MSVFQIDEFLDTLGEEAFMDANSLRKALAPKLKDMLQSGHAEAERFLIRKKNGIACAQRLSAQMDQIIHIAYVAIVERLYKRANPSSSERLAIVATGGYGRDTLAPGSDVDLLFLLPYKQTDWSEGIIETMLYLLWDLKLKVGHATRSVDDCINEAKGDITIRTSLLEARFLFGNKELFEEMESRFQADIVRSTAAEFVEAKLKERDERIVRVGASRYLVEPNVKDGKGGLRDLHTLFWIVKYVYGTADMEELIKLGMMEEEARIAERCTEFLWRVRCHMHFAVGRAEERLTFDLQPIIAKRMGYKGRSGLSSVERFMKAYFLIAKDVGDLTAALCAILESQQTKKKPLLNRIVAPLKRRKKNILGEDDLDFVVDNDRINVISGAFSRDQMNLIKLFWLSSRHNLPIHPDAKRQASVHAKEIGPALRRSKEANRLFLDILTSKNFPEVVLRAMNEAGVLGRFVPEFSRVVAMMQFNMYHHYTVDEHLLRCIGVISEIEHGKLGHEHPVAHSIFKTLHHRRALYVAAFLHDIAKGRPEDHSEGGARIAQKLCPRFGLSPSETDTVVWLVRYHLLMSDTAQRRDLSDPMTIKNFASVVQTMERLRLLLILTVADIKAVGHGVWTGWKGELLRSLYYETEIALGGGETMKIGQRIDAARRTLRDALPEWSEDNFKIYADRHSKAYWTTVEPARQVKHALMMSAMEERGDTVLTTVETDHFRGVTELFVISPDHPRLLTIITGACTAAGANIVDAKIFTTNDGTALDTIVISRAFDRDEDEMRRGQRIAQTIEKGLKGQVRIADFVKSRKPSSHKAAQAAKTFRLGAEVVIDNALASRQTVLEVSGLDRPGLLYDLTSTIGRLNLNIASAHIATYGEKAVDAFYVTDLLGTKIVHPSRQNTIRKALMEVFADEHYKK
ncbi:[protein-PII] uridylyltransferase [Microvirga sp. W0021]|uniref:Bifunctional uridylyltransferase/uridylyl-removing enzyme n=1 Tax=Hohaiivirga grylli TaxID=3133970 RepID=A0ABV0BMW8_9HYPH